MTGTTACAPSAVNVVDYLLGGARGDGTPPAWRSTVEREVGAFVHEYPARLSLREPDAARTILAPDPRFQWIEDGVRRYASADDVVETLASFPPETEVSTTLSDVDVVPLASDLATASAEFETTITGVAPEPIRFGGALSMVVERSSSGWRIVRGHSSSRRYDDR